MCPRLSMPAMTRLAVLAVALALAGCAAAPPKEAAAPALPSAAAPAKPGSGYYKDDGPGDRAPADLDAIAEPDRLRESDQEPGDEVPDRPLRRETDHDPDHSR